MTRPARRRGLFALALALWGAALARDGFDRWIDATDLPATAIAQSTELLARDGQLLRAWPVADGRWRLGSPPEATDPLFLAMLLAYEDKRFHSHPGVDARAVLRAGGQALTSGRIVSGGSTLTMQVARLLEESGTGNWRGKLRQARVALALERRLDKAQILTLYLTLAPYGGNIEGLRAASLSWLGREPHRLTPAEAALLIALPQAPEARRPDRNPAAARAARDRVLARMVQAGVIDADTAQAALTEPVPVARRPFAQNAPHLGDRLRAADPLAQRLDSTLDAPLQRALEALAAEAVAGRADTLSVAILVADHRTGEVLAHVGSPDYAHGPRQGFVDMTRAIRSPGSTLKPLVYALAFDEGLAHPETIIDDHPVRFGSYAPRNFDGKFRGELRVAEALQMSLNTPVVQLTEALGPARLMAAMARAGSAAEVPGGAPGLAVALGGVGISLHDLVQIYAALGNGGAAVELHATPGGSPARAGEAAGDDPPGRVTSARAAWQVGHVLSGQQPPAGAPPHPIAWKTGTSYGHRDALAVGWDGRHVIGVWMGRADGTPVPGAFGGDLAAPILFRALARLKPRPDPLPPPPADTLLVTGDRLPLPLQRFANRHPGANDSSAPRLAFPPDGARVDLSGLPLIIKLRDGVPPFTVLANGAPVLLRAQGRDLPLPGLGPGFVTLSVIDAEGRAASAAVRID